MKALAVFCFCLFGLFNLSLHGQNIKNKKFILLDRFALRTDDSCNSEQLVANFVATHGSTTPFNAALMNDPKDSSLLKPRHDYIVSLWGIAIDSAVIFEEVLSFSNSQHAILNGARGLVLAFEALRSRSLKSGVFFSSLTTKAELGLVYQLKGSMFWSPSPIPGRSFDSNHGFIVFTEKENKKRSKGKTSLHSQAVVK